MTAQEQRRSRRRVWFWCVVVLLIVLALPVVAFFGTIAYISLGCMNESIAQKIGAAFDQKASVGSVSSPWLQGLRVDRIKVETADPERPLTVGSVMIDWDIADLYNERHIRSVHVDHPVVNLKRGENGAWNVALKPADPHAPSYKVDRIQMSDGEVCVEWAPGRRARLQSLAASFVDAPPSEPKPFSIKGALDSLEPILLDGTIGPGNAWQMKLKGGLYLDRDLAPLAGPMPAFKGHVKYEAATSRPQDDAAPLPIAGKLYLEEIAWPFSSDSSRPLDLLIPQKTLSFDGQLRIPKPPPPSVLPGPALDVEVWALSDCRLSAEGVGDVSFSAVMKTAPAEHLVLNRGSATLDFDAIQKLFTPSLLGEYLSVSGKAVLKDGKALLPLSENAPQISASGTVEAAQAKIAIKDVGALPPLDLSCDVDYPAVREARIRMGTLASARVRLDDMRLPGTDVWQALTKNIHVEELNADLGAILQTEFGRRLASGKLDAKTPPAEADVPFSFKGRVEAQRLNIGTELREGSTCVLLSAVQLKDVSLQRWPLPFKVPSKTFTGQVDTFCATLAPKSAGGDLRKLSFIGKVTTTSAAKEDTPTAFEASMEKNAKGFWQPGTVRVDRISVPVPELDRIFSFSQSSGVTATGNVVIEDASFSPVAGKLNGTVVLEGATARVPLSRSIQGLMLEALKMTKYASFAPILEYSPIEYFDIDEMNARLKLSLVDGRVQIRGKTEPIFMRISKVIDKRIIVPRVDVTLNVDLPGKMPRQASVALSWGGPDPSIPSSKDAVPSRIELSGEETGPNQWKLSGSASLVQLGAVKINFEAPLDLNANKLGPLVLTCGDQDLEKMSDALRGLGLPALADLPIMSGALHNLRVEVDAVSLDKLSATNIPKVTMTAELEKASLLHSAVELDQLTGQFIAKLSSDGQSLSSSINLQLNDYQALMVAPNILIPPPQKGKSGNLVLVSNLAKKPDGTTDIRLDRFEFDLGQLLQVAASGSITSSADGKLAKVDLPRLHLQAPDLRAARALLGDLSNRAPWFGDIGLAGPAAFDGALALDSGKASVLGKVSFNGSTVTLGKQTVLTLSDLEGQLPLNLHFGEGEAAREISGKLKIGSLNLGAVSAASQELTLTAIPNGLRVTTPYTLRIPDGELTVSDAGISEKSEGAEIAFKLATRFDIAAALKRNAIALSGLDSPCVLSGTPMACRIYEVRDALGSDWRLESQGGVRAPFFGGEIVVANLYGRGLFGPAPVWGVNDIDISAPEGIKVTQIVERNQQFFFTPAVQADEKFVPAKFSLRANLSIKRLRFSGADLNGVQAFVANVTSADFKDNEFYYNGALAMWLNYPLVRASFPKALFSDEAIKNLHFGVRKLGFQYELREGMLEGPRPLLPGSLIIEGYGSEINPFAQTYKKDIEAEHHQDNDRSWFGTRKAWIELIGVKK